MEEMTTVLLPITGEELEAVLRVCEAGEEAAGEDWNHDNEDNTNLEDEVLMHTKNTRNGKYMPYSEEIMKVDAKVNIKDNAKIKGETARQIIATNTLIKERVKRPYFKCPLGCGKKLENVNEHKMSVTEHNLKVHLIPSSCCSQTYDDINSYQKHLNQSHRKLSM